MQGNESGYVGTAHFLSRLIFASHEADYNSVIEPWNLLSHPSYGYTLVFSSMSADAIETAIRAWATESISNFHQFQAFEVQKIKAVSALKSYYQDKFGIPENRSEYIASIVVDRLISQSFVFESSKLYPPELRDTQGNGAALNEVRRYREDHLSPETPEIAMRLLTWALLFGAEREDVGYLLDHGATVSNGGVQDNHFEEPTLFYALENASLAELLIERGANVEAANNFGKTALMYAAQYDQAAVIKLLLAHGAKVSAKTQLPPMEDPSPENSDLNIKCDQRTALLYAAENASAQTINLLIDGGAKSNETDTCGHQVIEYLTQNLLLSAEEQKGIVARLSIH